MEEISPFKLNNIGKKLKGFKYEITSFGKGFVNEKGTIIILYQNDFESRWKESFNSKKRLMILNQKSLDIISGDYFVLIFKNRSYEYEKTPLYNLFNFHNSFIAYYHPTLYLLIMEKEKLLCICMPKF